jgi:murein L,D-transpeptidase YafK
MTDRRMAQASGSKHEDFWKNLREGYDLFEKNRIPPEAEVSEGRYIFK